MAAGRTTVLIVDIRISGVNCTNLTRGGQGHKFQQATHERRNLDEDSLLQGGKAARDAASSISRARRADGARRSVAA
jgi:hypothetical protein